MGKFAKRLYELRKEKRLSIRSLAKKVGVSPTSIVRYENSECEPNFNNLEKMADLFGVSIDYLLGRVDYDN